MENYSMTINLGSGDEGRRRNEAYRKAASESGLTLNAWIKKQIDTSVNFRYERTNPPADPA